MLIWNISKRETGFGQDSSTIYNLVTSGNNFPVAMDGTSLNLLGSNFKFVVKIDFTSTDIIVGIAM